MSGSIKAGTAEHRLDSIETVLALTADAEADVVARVVDQAERMCFVLDALRRPHTVRSSTTLNGRDLAPAPGGDGPFGDEP